MEETQSILVLSTHGINLNCLFAINEAYCFIDKLILNNYN